MKDKVMSYLFSIALRISGYTFKSAVLQKDLQISSNKSVMIAYCMKEEFWNLIS